MADIAQAEREIFGPQQAFSTRWTGEHGLPDMVPANPYRGFAHDFSPAELLSEISEVGLPSPTAWERASYAIDLSTNPKFRIAAQNGLLRAMVLDVNMRSSRIDTVADTMRGSFGLTPQGIAQWLLADQETRRSLALIFRLQGYNVATEADREGRPIRDEFRGLVQAKVRDEQTGKDRIVWRLPGLEKETPLFSNHRILRKDHVNNYLKAVQEAVGTDPGVVRIAYTIFRALGHPHENAKFSGDLYGKYMYDPKTGKGDLAFEDIQPFTDKFNVEIEKQSMTLRQIIERDGMVGLAIGLNRIRAELLGREWSDMQTILDTMDQVGDIRRGTGGAATMSIDERQKALLGIKEGTIALAKRKFSEQTARRLFDLSKISTAPGAAAPSFKESYNRAFRLSTTGMVLDSLFGRRNKPTFKGEEKKEK